jgi:hypothetical protein
MAAREQFATWLSGADRGAFARVQQLPREVLMDTVTGNAWLQVYPANGRFAVWLLETKRGERSQHGIIIPIFHHQGYAARYAHAQYMAEYLNARLEGSAVSYRGQENISDRSKSTMET